MDRGYKNDSRINYAKHATLAMFHFAAVKWNGVRIVDHDRELRLCGSAARGNKPTEEAAAARGAALVY